MNKPKTSLEDYSWEFYTVMGYRCCQDEEDRKVFNKFMKKQVDKALANQKDRMKKLVWYKDETIGTKPNEKNHKIIVIKKVDWNKFIERV